MRTSDEAAFRFLTAQVLQPGEALVWTGRPSPVAAAGAGGGPPPVATLVLVGVVLWLGGRVLEPLFGLVLTLMLGLWVVTTPRRHRWRARRLYYAVTDRRALVIENLAGWRYHRLPPGPFEREDHGDGTASFQLRGDVARLTEGLWGVSDPGACARALDALPIRRGER